MKQQIVYNLEEFAVKYHLTDIYGAYAAHFAINGGENNCVSSEELAEMVKERTLFTKLLLLKQGKCLLHFNSNKDETLEVKTGEFLITSPKEIVALKEVSTDFEAECILVDEHFTDQPTRYQPSPEKMKSIADIFHFVRDIVRHQHINKIEMIKSMFNVLKLIIEELPYEQCSVSNDLGHKKEVYEIFLHHLYRFFRKERQIRFYADKQNVSAAYLSRLVREISGSTVNEHVTSLVYKEICNLLTQSDMTMGEIADYLNFSDQSALTNFFKQRSGMTPLAYRGKK